MTNPPRPLPPEVLAAFERGRPIEAIRMLIRASAGSRAVAKPAMRRATEAAPQRAKPLARSPSGTTPSRRGLSPGEVPRSDSAFWGWVVAALFAYLAYRLVRG